MLDRRSFLVNAVRAAVAGSMTEAASALAQPPASTSSAPSDAVGKHSLHRHRFGVNYTPTRNWWFCWNDWDPSPIQKDLDGIHSVGADHMRLLLIWPYFQPNLSWVSPVHLERLDQLLGMMEQRNLDAVVTVFTGQLSGWFFLPPFNQADTSFYTSDRMWLAQELFVRRLAAVLERHRNVIGFDIGNEINTCWKTDPATGDRWMRKMLALMQAAVPQGLHVNGVDDAPWFQPTTFSPRALASLSMPTIHCYPYWTGALQYGGPMDPPSVDLIAAMGALVRSYAGAADKPVWAEEFNTCIDTLTEKQQAQWLEAAVLAAMDSGVSWFTYWDSHDLDRKFTFNPVEYHLGLLDHQGHIKDQGRVFKQLAEAYRGKPAVGSAKPVLPPPANYTRATTWSWLMNWMGWKSVTPS